MSGVFSSGLKKIAFENFGTDGFPVTDIGKQLCEHNRLLLKQCPRGKGHAVDFVFFYNHFSRFGGKPTYRKVVYRHSKFINFATLP